MLQNLHCWLSQELHSQFSTTSRLRLQIMTRRANLYSLSGQGNSHQLGHLKMVSSSTNDGYTFPHLHLSYKKYCTPSIMLHMRDLKKHCIDSVKLFTLPKPNRQFSNSLVTVQSVNEIKQSTSIQLDFFNHSQFQNKFGKTSPWTLSKHCLRWEVNQLY